MENGGITRNITGIWNGGDCLIDEKKIIKKLENRIDEFLKGHPDKKDCLEVRAVEEFIHMLELEAKCNGDSCEG